MGKKKLSQIQFLISNDTNLHFTIPSKEILTVFSSSHEQMYSFEISLSILNGKNHLDYRYQKFMSIVLVSMVILAILAFFNLCVNFKLGYYSSRTILFFISGFFFFCSIYYTMVHVDI